MCEWIGPVSSVSYPSSVSFVTFSYSKKKKRKILWLMSPFSTDILTTRLFFGQDVCPELRSSMSTACWTFPCVQASQTTCLNTELRLIPKPQVKPGSQTEPWRRCNPTSSQTRVL